MAGETAPDSRTPYEHWIEGWRLVGVATYLYAHALYRPPELRYLSCATCTCRQCVNADVTPIATPRLGDVLANWIRKRSLRERR